MTMPRQEYLDSHTLNLEKSVLVKLYSDKKMSLNAIATELDCGASTVRKYLRIHDIDIRPMSEINSNRKHSDATKAKIAMSKIGRKRAPFSEEWLKNLSKSRVGRPSSMLGKKHSEAAKLKMSIAHKGQFSGSNNPMFGVSINCENHHNWKGGITRRGKDVINSYEYSKWRTSVYERDNFTCQRCNDSSGGNLAAHHMASFLTVVDLRYELSNGITFCKNCHQLFHSIYGRGGTTVNQTIEFLFPNQERSNYGNCCRI